MLARACSQVVVGAAVETGDPVANRVARGQHQDRGPDAGLAQSPADLEAVDAGKHQVEDDRVVLDRRGLPARLLAGAGDVDRHPLAREPAPDQARHLGFVLDDQDTHPIRQGGSQR
jgi:hypothetical protein